MLNGAGNVDPSTSRRPRRPCSTAGRWRRSPSWSMPGTRRTGSWQTRNCYEDMSERTHSMTGEESGGGSGARGTSRLRGRMAYQPRRSWKQHDSGGQSVRRHCRKNKSRDWGLMGSPGPLPPRGEKQNRVVLGNSSRAAGWVRATSGANDIACSSISIQLPQSREYHCWEFN